MTNEPSAEVIALVTNGHGNAQQGRQVFEYILWMREEIARVLSIIDITRFHLVRGDHHVHGCVDQIIDAHERALQPRTP